MNVAIRVLIMFPFYFRVKQYLLSTTTPAISSIIELRSHTLNTTKHFRNYNYACSNSRLYVYNISLKHLVTRQ